MRRSLTRLSGPAVPLGAAAVALLTAAGPAAAGTGYGQLIVNPGTAAPGQSVSILGTCPNNGTGLRGVFSTAFAGGSASVTRTSINFSGTATIAQGTAGTYTVTADCGTGSPVVTITVSGSAPASHPVATTPSAMSGSRPTNPATSAPAPMAPGASTGSSAIVGGAPPKQSMSPSPMSSEAAAGAQAMAGGASGTANAAGNGPVTSTGVVQVGLAGSSRSLMTTTGVAAIAAAVALAGSVGFLMIRRRRNTPGSHI